MLSASSPIVYPPSSSPVNAKRPKPHDDRPPPKRPATVGGFLVDDDSEDDEGPEEPLPKRRMLEGALAQDRDRDNSAPAPGETPPSGIVDVDLSGIQDGITTPPDSQPKGGLQLEDHHDGRFSRLFDPARTSLSSLFHNLDTPANPSYEMVTCAGKSVPVRERKPSEAVAYASMVAARSRTKEGRAKRGYFGIEIHQLVSDASKELAERRNSAPTAPVTPPANSDLAVDSVEGRLTNLGRPKRSLLWTEKYRARSFIDLVGDDHTNRQVLRWLKHWDPIVFPHSSKSRPVVVKRPGKQNQPEEEKPHRKILILAGPPGLGKTTLAHVCARQAGYEVMEINASDERSRDVVKGRIRTSLGTENVKTVEHKKPEPGKRPKVARPVCVVVDEVDGVVSGSGGSGEGGFVKALIDLVMTDQKNSSGVPSTAGRRKRKGDDFKQMRPLVLICNDVYHTSLRPLRQSGLAEIVHVGKPSVEVVVSRLKTVFEKEGIPCEKDAARRLCEAAWGMTGGIDSKKGAQSNAEGDLRGIMVVGEWVAGRLKASSTGSGLQLTRQWIDRHIAQDLAHGGGGARGLGRGSSKEIVSRVFQEGAGFPRQSVSTTQPKNLRHEQPQTQLGFSEHLKKYAMSRLAEMVDTSGEVDRIMTEIFSEYPNREFNDDSFLTKPDAAYEWMNFHNACQSRLYSSQDWELAPYLSQPVLACHHLFASPRQNSVAFGYGKRWGGEAEDEAAEPPLPFSGPRADYAAYEAEKANRAVLQGLHAQLPPSLMRAFRSPEHLATDFLPYLVRLVSPDVKPVVVGGGGDKFSSIASVRKESEKTMVRRAAQILAEVGIELQKGKVEAEGPAAPVNRPQWVYRMEP